MGTTAKIPRTGAVLMVRIVARSQHRATQPAASTTLGRAAFNSGVQMPFTIWLLRLQRLAPVRKAPGVPDMGPMWIPGAAPPAAGSVS